MAETDVIVIGTGLAGFVAAAELADAGRRVLVLDQKPEQNLGGQAFWSLGGLFMVDMPEQRRMRIRGSHELAWQDWIGIADFDRDEDAWPRRWARLQSRGVAAEVRGRRSGETRHQRGDKGDEHHAEVLHEDDEADIGAVVRGHQRHRRGGAGKAPHSAAVDAS